MYYFFFYCNYYCFLIYNYFIIDNYKMAKRYLSISSANGGSGYFGYTNGNPQLTFLISDVGLLQSKELRLQGNFKRVLNTNTAHLNEVDNSKDLNLDSFVGLASVVNNVEISSRAYSNRSLELIQNYPRLVSNFMSALHSKSGLDTQMFHEQGCKGSGFDTVAEANSTTKLNDGNYSSVGQKISSRIPYCAKKGLDFDIRLMCGMFMSEDIDLENIGGLAITINLAPNENVLFGADASNYHYEIQNPRIIVPVISKTAQQQVASAQNPSPVINFLSFTSLYNVITSTEQQVVHRVSLKGVISSQSNFIPVSYINSFTRNGLAQYNPAIQRLVYHLDGKRFPLEYSIEVDRDETLNQDSQPSTNPQLLRNYLEAFRNARDIKKSSLNPVICSAQSQVAEHGLFGVGCSFDSVSNAGIPAQVSTLGFEVQSKIQDPASFNTTPTQLNYAVYTYYLCRNSIRVVQGQGIQVVQ